MRREVIETKDGQHSKEELLFHQFFEQNGAIKLLIDQDTNKIEDANSAAELFYGYPKNTLCLMYITDIYQLDGEDVVSELHQSSSGTKTRCLLSHRIASGETRRVEVFSGTITFRGRDFLLSIIHDISGLNCKEKDVSESKHIIENVLNEKMHFLRPLLAEELRKQFYDLKTRGVNFEEVSDREHEVLTLIGHGFGLSEIAGQFCVSSRTIESHLMNLRKKFGVKNNRELTRAAIRLIHHGR